MRSIQSYDVSEVLRYKNNIWDKYRVIGSIIRFIIMYSIISLLIIMVCRSSLNQVYILLAISFFICLTRALKNKNTITIDTIKYFTTILFCEFFIAMLAEERFFMVGAFVLELILVMITIIYLPMQRLKYLLSNEEYSINYKKRIRKNTFKAGIILASITMIINIFAYFIGVFNIFGYIDKLIYSFMQLMKPENHVSIQKEMKGKTMTIEYGSYNSGDSGNILEYVLCIIMIILIPMIIFTIINIIRGYRSSKKIVDKDMEVRTSIFDKDDLKDEVKGLVRHINIKFSKGNLSNREKIRQMYKSRIIDYKNKGVDINKSDSVWEIENKVNGEKEIPIAYEEVRYGNREISDEQVSFFEKFIK